MPDGQSLRHGAAGQPVPVRVPAALERAPPIAGAGGPNLLHRVGRWKSREEALEWLNSQLPPFERSLFDEEPE